MGGSSSGLESFCRVILKKRNDSTSFVSRYRGYSPLLHSAPIIDMWSSLQKYNIERQTKSEIYFDKFKYVSDLKKKKDEDEAEFNETLMYYDTKTYRENKHTWFMPSKERMINLIQSAGFRFIEDVDLVRCKREYQYLCYFQK